MSEPRRVSTRPKPNRTPDGASPRTAARGVIIGILLAAFVVSVAVRWGIFQGKHTEGDELIYQAFVEQLDRGRGYTLRGHWILAQPWIPKDQYDQPLFYHPPGGMVFFWGLCLLFGEAGFGAAQLVSHAVFFWGMALLARAALPRWGVCSAALTALMAAFTPIAAHVHAHYWLDGPQLALVTLGSALLALWPARRRLALPSAAGLLLGWACLTKLNAALVFPALLAMLLALRPPDVSVRRLVGAWGAAVLIALVLTTPWFVMQWQAYGTPIPPAPGRPSATLIAQNSFVRLVTVARSPWIYLRLLPQTVWTLAPACLLLGLQWRRPRVRRLGLALLFWIALVVATNIGLGCLGYSKLLRYVILITPAAILLFVLTAGEAFESCRRGQPLPGGVRLTTVLLAGCGLALGLEVLHGVRSILLHPSLALIPPLFGRLS